MAQFRLVWLVLVIFAISISTRYGGANGQPPAEKEDAVANAKAVTDLLDKISDLIEKGKDVPDELLKEHTEKMSELEKYLKRCNVLARWLKEDVANAEKRFKKAIKDKGFAVFYSEYLKLIARILRLINKFYCDCADQLEKFVTGASIKTGKASGLEYSGKEASRALAKADVENIETYKECFDRVGKKYVVSSSLLAGLVSRMTRGGTTIEGSYGYSSDNTKYGLLPCDVTASGLGEDCKGFGWNTCDQVEMVVKRVLLPKMDEIMTDNNTKYLNYYEQLKMSLEVFNYYGEEDFTNDVLGRSMFYCDAINVTGDDDPHFFVPVQGSENPVCFDLYGETGQVFQLLEDKETGAVINAELTNGNDKFANGKWMGKVTVLKDGHSVYLDSDGITVDNATKGTWQQNISLAPMAMTMDQSSVNIFDLGDDVTATVRTNAFAALDIDILIKESSKTTNIGGLVGVAIDCLESVEVEDENEAILNLCGGRKVRSDLALRRQGKTPCWLVPFDTLFVGKDFMPPCLFCAMPKGKGKGNQ